MILDKKKSRVIAVILGRLPIQDALYAKKAGADMLELRLDQFRILKLSYLTNIIKEIKKRTRLPIIATLRDKREEKFLPIRHHISEEKRLEIILSLLHFVDLVDIELRAEITKKIISRAHALNKKVIVSYHNFKETPSFRELNTVAKKAKRAGGDFVKIATFAQKEEDVARLMTFTYLSRIRPIITIAMGKKGSISRIIAPIFGSCMTYTAITKKAAPGQLAIFRFQS